MKTYLVTCRVSDIGTIQHVIKAENKSAAMDRYKRAYSRRTCIHVETLVMIKNPYRDAA